MINEFNTLKNYDIQNLTDDWCFMSIPEFIDHIERGGLIDDDGYGHLIYINKNDGIMYLKKDEYISPSEIQNIIYDAEKTKDFFYWDDKSKAIKEKYTNGDYKPFAIFWYNR